MQHTIDIIKENITNIIPKGIFSSLIYPVIIIVITTRHTSMGNSKTKFPQSLLSLSLETKYFSKDTNTNKNTDNQNEYASVSGCLRLSQNLSIYNIITRKCLYHQYSVPTILQVVTPISFLKKISFVSLL